MIAIQKEYHECFKRALDSLKLNHLLREKEPEIEMEIYVYYNIELPAMDMFLLGQKYMLEKVKPDNPQVIA